MKSIRSLTIIISFLFCLNGISQDLSYTFKVTDKKNVETIVKDFEFSEYNSGRTYNGHIIRRAILGESIIDIDFDKIQKIEFEDEKSPRSDGYQFIWANVHFKTGVIKRFELPIRTFIGESDYGKFSIRMDVIRRIEFIDKKKLY